MPWENRDVPVEDISFGVFGEVISVNDDWHVDCSADCSQTAKDCLRGVPGEKFGLFEHELTSNAMPVEYRGPTSLYDKSK